MEHFFDGYKANPEFSLRALEAAVVKGASHVVLCDTNGGSLPHEIEEIVGRRARPRRRRRHRRHPLPRRHRLRRRQLDGRRAGGARHVQGTLNGLGERTGNANLTTIIPNLQLKLGYTCLPEGRLEQLTASATTSPSCSTAPSTRRRRTSARRRFAHKAGLHASAIARAKDAYEHVDPETVGNGTRFVVSARWPGGRRSR